jgi:hypothetical protein
MATISSINFQPVKGNSTSHNERSVKLDYVSPHLTKNNESWKSEEISTRFSSIADLTKELTGRKIQAKATPIREAVVNLRHDHTMEDLKKVRDVLKESYGIDAFQIHIHRDEGFGGKKDNFIAPLKLNLHAHMVFDWQDKETGKSFKLNRLDMSKIQTLVADTLEMDHGQSIANTNIKRLEAVEFKRQEEEKRIGKLQEQVALLEQKKNEAESRFERDSREASELESKIRALELQSKDREINIKASERARERRGRESREREESVYKELMGNPEGVDDFSEEEIKRTIVLAERAIDKEDQFIKQLKAKNSYQ